MFVYTLPEGYQFCLITTFPSCFSGWASATTATLAALFERSSPLELLLSPPSAPPARPSLHFLHFSSHINPELRELRVALFGTSFPAAWSLELTTQGRLRRKSLELSESDTVPQLSGRPSNSGNSSTTSLKHLVSHAPTNLKSVFQTVMMVLHSPFNLTSYLAA